MYLLLVYFSLSIYLRICDGCTLCRILLLKTEHRKRDTYLNEQSSLVTGMPNAHFSFNHNLSVC